MPYSSFAARKAIVEAELHSSEAALGHANERRAALDE